MGKAQIRFAAAAAALLGCTSLLSAGFIDPYGVDADTLHLWHMDEGSGQAMDSAGTLHLTNIDQSAEAANAAGGNTPATANVIYGVPGYYTLNTAMDFSNNATVPTTVNTGAQSTSPQRPTLAGATPLSTTDTTDVVPFSFANASTGAFTWEATIKFAPGFDPTSTTYRNTAGSAGGNYPMEIISGEGDTNAHRNWQFRFNQIGSGTSSGANGTTKPRLEFANLHGISGNQSIAVDLPTTGINAVNNTDWFHVAVQYTGAPNTADNLQFFWSDISAPANASLTDPVFLASRQMTASLLTAAANSPAFAIGNELRDSGSGAGEGESFVGSIDEVRMSGVVRYIPEPGSISVMVIAGIGLMARRRRK
jgi:hypothetical protein